MTAFEFGANWRKYLAALDDAKIAQAKSGLARLLGETELAGRNFLDIGCGSGLHSLAAALMGARVRSFDYDPQCVACAAELKAKYAKNSDWTIEQGSALDEKYLRSAGQYDIVYSWGVLHHTGDMWRALELAAIPLRPGGLLALALYNDQGFATTLWHAVKKTYNLLPPPLRFLVLYPAFARIWGPTTIKDFLKGKPFATWREYEKNRGMRPWTDVVDWVGGYPFEAASPEQVRSFYAKLGYKQLAFFGVGKGWGCNEYLFRAPTPRNRQLRFVPL